MSLASPSVERQEANSSSRISANGCEKLLVNPVEAMVAPNSTKSSNKSNKSTKNVKKSGRSPKGPSSVSSENSGIMKDSSSSGSSLNCSSSSILPNSEQKASDKTRSNRKYSRSHQRRFHRRFPAIDPQEKLINWYNCAFIADILLQGYLYISESYFAFYSNIFGYKTQLLIPICDVISVTKERTARIFPNAVGICTEEAKYVFGSLLSRDSTFRLMQEVWRSTLLQVRRAQDKAEPLLTVAILRQVTAIPFFNPVLEAERELLEGDIDKEGLTDEAVSGCLLKSKDVVSSCLIVSRPQTPLLILSEELAAIPLSPDALLAASSRQTKSQKSHKQRIPEDGPNNTIKANSLIHSLNQRLIHFKKRCQRLPKSSLLLLISTILLVILLVSAAGLLYRVTLVHDRMSHLEEALPQTWNYNQLKVTEGNVYFASQVKRVANDLKLKLNEMTALRRSLEELLHVVQRLPDYCSDDESTVSQVLEVS